MSEKQLNRLAFYESIDKSKLKSLADDGDIEAKAFYVMRCFDDGQINIEDIVEEFEKDEYKGCIFANCYLSSIYEKGTEHIEPNAEKAFKLLNKFSDSGEITVTSSLAYFYNNGIGTNIDKSKAFELYSKPECMVDANCICSLGLLYYHGDGIKKNVLEGIDLLERAVAMKSEGSERAATLLAGISRDNGNIKKAFEYEMIAAELGWAFSQFWVGDTYAEGTDDVERDIRQAVFWLEKAASQDYLPAMIRLGDIYFYDKYGIKNYYKAIKYFKMATENVEDADLFCLANLACMYMNGLGERKDTEKGKYVAEKVITICDKDMFDPEIYSDDLVNCCLSVAHCNLGYCHYDEGNFNKALDHLCKAIEIDRNSGALFLLGYMYENGVGVKRDLRKANDYYAESSRTGNIQAMYGMYMIYEHDKKHQKAFEILLKLSDSGESLANYILGTIYYFGEKKYGIGYRDYKQSFKYYELSAKQGNANGMEMTGIHYLNGWGVEKDSKIARNYIEKAAEMGYTNAKYRVGLMYYYVVPKDKKKGINWIEEAAGDGLNEAIEWIDMKNKQSEDNWKLFDGILNIISALVLGDAAKYIETT